MESNINVYKFIFYKPFRVYEANTLLQNETV